MLPSTDAMAKQRLRFFITDLVEAGLPDLAKRVLSNPDLALLLTPAESEHLRMRTKASLALLKPSWDQESQDISKFHVYFLYLFFFTPKSILIDFKKNQSIFNAKIMK